MEITETYFYLDDITEDFKKECKEAVLFRIENTPEKKAFINYFGYVWIKDGNHKWSEKNYKSNIRLYKVGDTEGVVYRNMVWFYGTIDETHKNFGKFEQKALDLFIEYEAKRYNSAMAEAKRHKSQVEFLKEFVCKY